MSTSGPAWMAHYNFRYLNIIQTWLYVLAPFLHLPSFRSPCFDTQSPEGMGSFGAKTPLPHIPVVYLDHIIYLRYPSLISLGARIVLVCVAAHCFELSADHRVFHHQIYRKSNISSENQQDIYELLVNRSNILYFVGNLLEITYYSENALMLRPKSR